MREIVFIADRKEGLEPAFSEGPVRTLSRWLSYIHGTVQMHRGHNPPARMSYSITSLTPCSTYKQDSLQRPLQAFVLDHLLQTQDHNPNLATSLLVSCGTRQNSRYQTLGKSHQETGRWGSQRSDAEYTLTPVSVTAEPSAQAHTFHGRVLRTLSEGGRPEQELRSTQTLDKAIRSISLTFLLWHQIQKLMYSFLRQWNLWLLATAWGVPNIFS